MQSLPIWLRRTLRVFLILLLLIVALFGVVWTALQVPAVQQRVVRLATDNLSQQLGTRVAIGKVNIRFFKTVVLEDIFVADQIGDTLLYAGRLGVDIGVLGLARQTIVVNEVGLERTVIKVYRDDPQGAFNYQFIVEAFASDSAEAAPTDTTASAWSFDLESLRLADIRLEFRDDSTGDDLRAHLHDLRLDLRTLGLDEMHPHVSSFDVEGLRVVFRQRTVGEPLADSVALAVAQRADTVAADTNTAFLEGFGLTLDRLRFADVHLTYDTQDTTAARGMDFNHLVVSDLRLALDEVLLADSTVRATVAEFGFRERSGFELQRLALQLRGDFPGVVAELTELRTGHSHLSQPLRVELADLRDEDVLGGLTLRAQFDRDSLAVRDAYYFAPALDSLMALRDRKLYLHGEVRLQEGELTLDQLGFDLDDQVRLRAEGTARHLTDPAQLYADLKIAPLRVRTAFLQNFLDPDDRPAVLDNLDTLTLTANLQGHLRDLRGAVSLRCDVGRLGSDFTLQLSPDFERQAFAGTLVADQFDLAAVLGAEAGVGRLSLDGYVALDNAPTGFRLDTARVHVQRLGALGYDYRDIFLGARLVNDRGRAAISSEDPHLQLRAEAEVDLNQESLAWNLRLERADLRALQLVDSLMVVALRSEGQLDGFDPNTLTGTAAVRDLVVRVGERTLVNDSLVLRARQADTRYLDLSADFMRLFVTGDFTVEDLPDALAGSLQRYLTFLEPPPRRPMADQTLQINGEIVSNPAIVEAFVPELRIGEPIPFSLNYASSDDQLQFDLEIPRLDFGAQQVRQFSAKVRTDSVLHYTLRADQFRLSEAQAMADPSLSGQVRGDEVDYRLQLADVDTTAQTNADLRGMLVLRDDTVRLEVRQSEAFFEGKALQIPDNGLICYAPNYLNVRNVEIRQDDQRLRIYTEPLPQRADVTRLRADIEQFSVGMLASLAGQGEYKLDGELNAHVRVDNVFDLERVDAEVSVDGLRADTLLLGDLRLEAGKRFDERDLKVMFTTQGQPYDLRVAGRYVLADGDQPDELDMQADLQRLDFGAFQPYLSETLKKLTGGLTGKLAIRGSTTDPRVEGQLQFSDNTLIRPVATDVPYNFSNQKIVFEGQRIRFRKFTMRDDLGNEATLTGAISYADLTDPTFDLTFNADNFRFLNVSRFDNPVAWGELRPDLRLAVTGPLSNLVVDVSQVRLGRDTDFWLSVDTDAGDIEQASYISLVDGRTVDFARVGLPELDSLHKAEDSLVVATAMITGITLRANVEIEPEAALNVVIDEKNNDELRNLRGNARLAVEMGPAGDLSIVGTYNIAEGEYRMNFIPALPRTFAIRENSTIQFRGEPTDIELGLTAVYRTVVSSKQLAPEDAEQRRAVEVLLKMEGELFRPQISFGVQAQEAQFSNFDYLIDVINREESELNKQVFGLIVLNRFLPIDGRGDVGSGGGNAVAQRIDQSVSELMSSQLNNLSDRYLGGVEVGVDYRSAESKDITEGQGDNLRVNVSKNLFNDRVRVQVGSGDLLGNEPAAQQQGQLSAVVGDVVIEYRLNQKGNLNLKFFRRINVQNVAAGGAAAGAIEVIGAGIAHRKNFDSFRKLTGEWIFPPRPEEVEEVEEEEDGKDTLPDDDLSAPGVRRAPK